MQHLLSRGGTLAVCAAFVFAPAFLIPSTNECQWSYPLWGIRSNNADPLFRIVKREKVGYLNAAGKIVIPPVLPLTGNAGGEFHDGLLLTGNGNRYSYRDTSLKEVIHVDASYASDFSEGLAAACLPHELEKCGYIDRTGQFAIAPRYWRVEPFSEGLGRVSESGEFGTVGYIDHQGRFVTPPHLAYGSDFHQGLAAVVVDGPCLVRNAGSCQPLIFEPQKSPAANCRYSYIDKTGKPAFEQRFDQAGDFSEGLAAVEVRGKWGYIDKTGQFVIPPTFDSAKPFSEGLAVVSQHGRFGYVDATGRVRIKPRYWTAESFSEGRALVSSEYEYTYIDKTGNLAFLGNFGIGTSFHHGLAHVAYYLAGQRGHFAWIDTRGGVVFDYIVP